MSKRILIVDDNFDATEITSMILVANGYDVDVAHNGRDALARIAAHHPALVILDIMMPDMSGMEVLDQIKAGAGTANIPVIMCTAKSRDADFLDGYKSGADYYVTKPFTAQQLMYGIHLLLGSAPDARS